MKKIALIILMMISAQSAFNQISVIADSINISRDTSFVIRMTSKSQFAVAFSFTSQNGTSTTIKLWENTDKLETLYHLYPNMPYYTLTDAISGSGSFRDPNGTTATHIKIVITLQSGKTITGFKLTKTQL